MTTRRILIVDDEHLTRVSLADFLQEAGYDTIITDEGASAIQLQREQPFDFCIVDIRMPGLDGVETILALHKVSPRSHYIIYTGSPGFTLPSALKAIGILERCIVRKPVLDMNVFLNLIAADVGIATDLGGEPFDE